MWCVEVPVQDRKTIVVRFLTMSFAPVGDVEEPLLRIAREGGARSSLSVAARRRLAASADKNLLKVLAVDGEHLQSSAAAVGNINHAVIRHSRCVNVIELRGTL